MAARHKAALYRYLGSQGGKAFHMLIDGTNAAEVAPAGHGDLCLTKAAQQCANEIIGSSDAAGQVIVGAGGVDVPAVNLHSMPVYAANIGTQIFQDFETKGDIRDLRNIFDSADTVYQKRGGNNGDSGVFGTADLYFPKQGSSSLVQYILSSLDPLFKQLAAGRLQFDKNSLPTGRRFIPAQIRNLCGGL